MEKLVLLIKNTCIYLSHGMHGYYSKCLNIFWVTFILVCAKIDQDLIWVIVNILFRMIFGSISFKYKSFVMKRTVSQILLA